MKNMLKTLLNWGKLRIYEILYIVLLIFLSNYILSNWEKCIAMKFFEQFDGNNILFLVWIVLIILPFYDVEAKGWKFRRKGIDDTRKLLADAESSFMQKQTSIIEDKQDSIQNNNSEEMDGGIV